MKTAEITIGRLTGPLTLAAAGGRGGDGGAGGHGGAGGDGGHVGPGFRTMAGPVSPGRPGRGGRGGDGGTGGRGGNGGISSNVFVTLPERMAGQLRVVTYPAPGGTGGAGGRPRARRGTAAAGMPRGGDRRRPGTHAGRPERRAAGAPGGRPGAMAWETGAARVRQRQTTRRKDDQPVSVSQILGSLGVPAGTASDGTVQTRISLHNQDQLKDLLDTGLPAEQRAQHASALLDGITAPDSQPGVALVHRLIRHVVGNDNLSDEDRAQLTQAGPITAHVTTQPPAADGQRPRPRRDRAEAGGGTAPPRRPPMQVNYRVGRVDAGRQPEGDRPAQRPRTARTAAASSPGPRRCTSPAPRSPVRAPRPPGTAATSTSSARPERRWPPRPLPRRRARRRTAHRDSAPPQASRARAASPAHPGSRGRPEPRARAGNDGIASAIATITITGSLTLTGAAKKQLVVATQSGPGGAGRQRRPGRPRAARRQRRQRRDLRLHGQRRRRRRARRQGRNGRPGRRRRERHRRRRQHRRVRARAGQHERGAGRAHPGPARPAGHSRPRRRGRATGEPGRGGQEQPQRGADGAARPVTRAALVTPERTPARPHR